jgi:hypothetical protein
MNVYDDTRIATWTVAAYAAKQPRGNTLWTSIVDKMVAEAETYLAFWAIVREA